MIPSPVAKAVVLAALAAVFAAAGCGGGMRASAPSTDAAVMSPLVTHSPLPSGTSGGSPGSTGSCGSVTRSIDYAPYTTATLAGYGWEFAVADVVGIGPGFFNTPDGSRPPEFIARPSGPIDRDAEPLVYTPVDVVIERSINGPSSPGPGQVLIEGGAVGCFTMYVDVAPRVLPGSRYVFVLRQAVSSAGEPSLGLNEAAFAWLIDAAGSVPTPDGRMSLEQLTQVVRGATPSPT